MKLTVQQLKDAQACALQVRRFRKLFGESVNVTIKLAVEHAGEFDWDWASYAFLKPPARAAYYKAIDMAEAAYYKALAAAWARAYNSPANRRTR